MHDNLTPAQRRACMKSVRTSGTAAELVLRKVVRELGYHFRVKNRSLPGRPDLANKTHRWALFVHGCFWHRHKNCARSSLPRTNADFWSRKLEANVVRDKKVVRKLRGLGYRVLVIWECELRRPTRVRAKIGRSLRRAYFSPECERTSPST